MKSIVQKERNTFAKNLKHYMLVAGVTQNDIVNDLKITASTVSDWFNGKKYPRIDRMQMLADYLNITITDLREDREIINGVTPVTNAYMIPVVANVRAGFDGAAIEDLQGYEPAYDIKCPEDCVWFKVIGNSMSPDIKDGDYALVRKQPDIENGEIGIVIYNGEDGTIKKVQKQENALSLIPLNGEFPAKVIVGDDLKDVIIYGKVIETKRKW